MTGLPASTLRYYESIGVIAPVRRDASSKHRVYNDADLDQLTRIAYLNAAGMSVRDISYLTTGTPGSQAAGAQIALLQTHHEHLVREGASLSLRRKYVGLKIEYWQAVAAGVRGLTEKLSDELRALANELTKAKRN